MSCFFQAEDGIRDRDVTGVQTCALPISKTVQLALAAMVLAALSGVTLGVVSAVRPGGAVDRVAMLVSYLGVSFPVYWVRSEERRVGKEWRGRVGGEGGG